MKKVIFLQDFFLEDGIGGGAELHDQIVADHFASEGILDCKVRCQDLTTEFIESNLNKFWFVSNFASLRNHHKALLAKKADYLIYEHDYKFAKNRNPISFPDFVAPTRMLCNVNFYRSAKKVVCLSKMHREIFEKNMKLDNYENINCSMWSDEQLDIFRKLCKTEKNDKFAVIKSSNPIKKTPESIAFCNRNKLQYDLIASRDYLEFMTMMSKYKGLVFMTGHPEPTPRVAIEAKMLNCKFLSQKHLIGVAHEDYFGLSGEDMINKVRDMREESLKKLTGWINEV